MWPQSVGSLLKRLILPIYFRYKMAFPSDAQKVVIRHRGKPLVVLAGPGSGKTATLVERVMQILSDEPAAQISFITFTRMSRRDTARKLEERFGREVVTQDDDTALPRVATLHTFAKAIVHRGARQLGLEASLSVLVPDVEDQIVLEEAKEDLGIDASLSAIRRYVEARRYMDAEIGTPGVTAEEARRLMPRLEELLKFYNATDIPGLVNLASQIVQHDPGVVGGVLLHIDEYQDLNRADQNLVLRLLELSGCETVVVGDDDQSIYGGRLANPEGIRELLSRDGWAHVVFRECHRLPGTILRASQSLLRLQQRLGFNKNVVMPPDDGTKVRVYQCTTPDVEIRRVVFDIKRRMEETGDSERPLRFSDFMILSPHGKGLVRVGEALSEGGIPTRSRTRQRISKELWSVLLLLRMIRSDDQIALRQWLPSLGLSSGEIRQLRHDAENGRRRLFDQARMVDTPEVREFIALIGQLRHSRDDLAEILRLIAGAHVLNFSTETMAMLDRAGARVAKDGHVAVAALVRSLYEEYGLLDQDEETADEDKVLLSTLHSSKGLEARVVYILHLDDRFIPAPGRDPDQEVRVLYVGMTRAKETLVLSFTERFEPSKYRRLTTEAASPFLHGISENVEFVRVTAKDLG